MRGRGGGSGGSGGSGGRSFSSGSSDNSGLIAGAIGYFGGSAAASGGTPTVGDGLKYGVKCSADDNSSYCQNVRMYNQFQMIVSWKMQLRVGKNQISRKLQININF